MAESITRAVSRWPLTAWLALLAAPFCLAARPVLSVTPFESKHFLLFPVAIPTETALQLGQAADEAWERIAADLGVRPPHKTALFLYGNRKAFQQALEGENPKLLVGAAHAGRAIHLDATGFFSSAKLVLAHEITHVLLAQALGEEAHQLPRWVNEGIAQYESAERGLLDELRVAEAISSGRALALERLDQALSGSQQEISLAYLQSASLIRFLVDSYGRDVLARLLGQLKHTDSFAQAIKQTTGDRLDEIEARWRAATVRRWRWVGLLLSPTFPLLLMALLLLIAMLRFWRLRRKRWEQLGE